MLWNRSIDMAWRDMMSKNAIIASECVCDRVKLYLILLFLCFSMPVLLGFSLLPDFLYTLSAIKCSTKIHIFNFLLGFVICCANGLNPNWTDTFIWYELEIVTCICFAQIVPSVVFGFYLCVCFVCVESHYHRTDSIEIDSTGIELNSGFGLCVMIWSVMNWHDRNILYSSIAL